MAICPKRFGQILILSILYKIPMTSKAEAMQGCLHGTGGDRQAAATRVVSDRIAS